MENVIASLKHLSRHYRHEKLTLNYNALFGFRLLLARPAANFGVISQPDNTVRTEKRMDTRPPLPPFNFDTATQKARMAEDAWNRRDPVLVSKAYTPDSRWRNRAEFFSGREKIVEFLTRKWARELDYRLIKELWAFHENRIAVRFQVTVR